MFIIRYICDYPIVSSGSGSQTLYINNITWKSPVWLHWH